MWNRFDPMILSRLTVAAGLLLGFGQAAQAANPFAPFAGLWSGGGEIVASGGSHEKIRCKAKYSGTSSQDSLHTNVRCASDSYKVHILIDVQAQGSSFTGTWQETTRQASGDVSGRIPAKGQLQASLNGVGFGIQLSASSNGRQQTISIQSQNTDVETVTIMLRKN